MSEWVRPLSQSSKDAALWHAARIRSYTTTTHCDKVVAGAIEVTSDDKAERDGRCPACVKDLTARAGTPPPRSLVARRAAATKAANTKANTKAANTPRRAAVAKSAARTKAAKRGRG